MYNNCLLTQRQLDNASRNAKRHPERFAESLKPGDEVNVMINKDPLRYLVARVASVVWIHGANMPIYSLAFHADGQPGIYIRTEARFEPKDLNYSEKPTLRLI